MSWTARAITLIVLCVAPWWYGGVELDIQVWLASGLLVALACWIGSSICSVFARQPEPVRLPSLLIALFGALLLGAVQLCPPISISTANPVATANDSTAIAAPSIRAILPNHPQAHSIYPAATRLEIARLGMAIVACYLGIVLFRDSRCQLWLWGSFALNGAALAFFGIVQQLSWNGKLFWTVPLLLGGQPFASYVNRNNAAGYLNLCLAGACGVAIWLLFRTSQGRNSGASSVSSAGTPTHRESPQIPRRRSLIDGPSLSAVLIAAVIAAGIVCSVSRGGVLAMLTASITVFALLARTRAGVLIGTLFVGILALGVGLVYWTGLEDRFFDRWSTTVGDTLESGAQTRLANWRDALKSTREFPAIGTGFGTYSFAYLPYQSWPAKYRFYNADNQFVEALVEGGWIGLMLVLLALGLGLTAAFALIRVNSLDPAGIVGVFAIASQMVSAFFDFGTTMFANMVALAVLTGAVASRAANLETGGNRSLMSRWLRLPELKPAGIMAVVSIALLGYGLLELRELSAAADCRRAWRELPRRLDTPDALEELPLEAAIQQLTNVLAVRPDDAEAHATLANLFIYRYRRQAFAELADLNRRGGPAAKWGLTDPIVLYGYANEWRRGNALHRLDELREIAVVQNNLVPAYQHLAAAQRACPLMPGLDVLRATLAFVVRSKENVVESSLRRAVALAPMDTKVLATCGTLAQSAGLSDLALECRQRLNLESDRSPKIRRESPSPE